MKWDQAFGWINVFISIVNWYIIMTSWHPLAIRIWTLDTSTWGTHNTIIISAVAVENTRYIVVMQLDFHSIIINIGLRCWSLERRLSIARHYYIAIVHPNLAITSKTCSHCPIKRFGTLQHQQWTGIFQKFIISLPPEHKHWDKILCVQTAVHSLVHNPKSRFRVSKIGCD